MITLLFSGWGNQAMRSEEGAVAVETAISLSLLLMLVFGIIEFSLAFWQWNTMRYAVSEAGRYVMVNNATCGTSCAQSQMQTHLPTAAICTTPSAGAMCVNATTTAGTPSIMTLTARYSFTYNGLTSLLGVTGPTLITSRTMVPQD